MKEYLIKICAKGTKWRVYKTQEVKLLKFLVEIQLKITNVVLQEHKKQIQEENQNNTNCLEEIQRKQRKSLEKLNTVLGIGKEA